MLGFARGLKATPVHGLSGWVLLYVFIQKVLQQIPYRRCAFQLHCLNRYPRSENEGVRVLEKSYKLTRIIKPVVTGQAPVNLGWKNTQGKKQNRPNVVHVHIIT